MTSSDIDELVSYLDGEVSDEARGAIEARLAEDASYREILLELQASWQLLDRLERAGADDSFTKTTIAMVTRDLRADPSLNHTWTTTFRSAWRRWGWSVAGLAVAALLGFAAVYLPIHRQYQRQLQDMPVAHNLDLYRYADSLEFIQMLDESGIFADEINDEL